MGNNLTGQLISATYEQLVQISGSILTNGTGSDITNLTVNASTATSASFATTASYAESAAGVENALSTASISNATITFTKGDASTFPITVNNVVNADSASVATNAVSASTAASASLVNVVATSTNLDYPLLFAYQSGYEPIRVDSQNLALYYNPSTNRLTTQAVTSTSITASVSVTSPTFFGDLDGNAETATNATSASFASNAASASFASTIANGLNINANTVTASAAQFVNLIATSASFGYVNVTTGSAVIIGEQYIILNADSPAARYAGIQVYDSSSASTGSFEWDSADDNWIQVNTSGQSAGFLTGISGSKGSEAYPTVNALIKGTGNHTVTSSAVIDNGTSVSIYGLTYPNTDGTEGQVLQTDGAGNVVFGEVETIYETIYAGENLAKTDPVYLSGSNGANPIAYKADAGNAAKMPVTYIMDEAVGAGNTGRAIALGLISGIDLTGYVAGQEVYVAVGGGWTATRPTGSAIVQALGIVTKGGAGGKGVVLNPGPVLLPNINSGSVWVGGANSVPVAVPTASLSVASASFATTASFALNTPSVFPYTGSAIISGSLVITGSGTPFTITDGTEIATVSMGASAVRYSNARTNGITSLEAQGVSDAITVGGNGAIGFYGIANDPDIAYRFFDNTTGSLWKYGLTTTSGGLDISTVGTTQLTLRQQGVSPNCQFNWTGADLNVSNNSASSTKTVTFTNFTGILFNTASLNDVGDATFKGDVIVSSSLRGSVIPLVIASNTASIDASTGNFFTLTLVNGSDTHLSASNINPGQTINLRVTQPATGSGTLSYNGTYDFAGGTPFTASLTASQVDIMTFIAFDNTTLYGTGLKNFS